MQDTRLINAELLLRNLIAQWRKNRKPFDLVRTVSDIVGVLYDNTGFEHFRTTDNWAIWAVRQAIRRFDRRLMNSADHRTINSVASNIFKRVREIGIVADILQASGTIPGGVRVHGNHISLGQFPTTSVPTVRRTPGTNQFWVQMPGGLWYTVHDEASWLEFLLEDVQRELTRQSQIHRGLKRRFSA